MDILENKCFRISLSLQLTFPRVQRSLSHFQYESYQVILTAYRNTTENVCACVEIDYESGLDWTHLGALPFQAGRGLWTLTAGEVKTHL